MRPPSIIPPLDLPDLPPAPHERLAPLQVTITEAARLLAYDARTIRQLITRGELVVVGQGRLRRVSVQSLHEYQQRNRG
jgi:excisionase family DNA binding protein